MSTSASKTANAHASKPAQPDPLIGRLVNDRFRIISVIARGGMGRVYRAEQVPLGRLVAIKTLDMRHEGGDNDPEFQQRFFLEASIASKLQHPNTVTVFDYGRTVDDLYFIAMELVEGRSLLNLIRTEAPLPFERAVHIALQIARSLREAHRLDVIHRDLKPGNVLLTKHGDEEDFVKVLDFGLVKHIESEADQELTKAGLFMGSPKYMAPEQIRGEAAIDGRADIYALGVVLYEMLSGKVPFDRENTVKLLMAHLHEPVPALVVPGCPTMLTQLVMRCLAKDPNQRPSTMDDLIGLLKHAYGMPSTPSGSYAVSQEVRLRVHGDSMPPSPTLRDTRLFPHTESGVITHSGHGPLSAMPVAARHGGPGLLPKLAVIAALGIAGGFLALRFSERGNNFTAQPVQEAGASPSFPSAPEGALANQPVEGSAEGSSARDQPSSKAPSAAAHIVVRLNSVPSGATVSADGKVYGQTPADIEWWGELAQPGRQITFQFTKDGYQKVTVVRELRGDTLEVEATLHSNERHPRSHPTVRKEPAAPTRLVVPPTFKNDPY